MSTKLKTVIKFCTIHTSIVKKAKPKHKKDQATTMDSFKDLTHESVVTQDLLTPPTLAQ
jgi:hypothetical protein